MIDLHDGFAHRPGYYAKLAWQTPAAVRIELFRYDNRKRTKTNLMVFLKPTVVRSGAATNSLTADRYEYLMGEQQRLAPPERPFWPDPNVPVLPPLPPPSGAAGAPQGGAQTKP